MMEAKCLVKRRPKPPKPVTGWQSMPSSGQVLVATRIRRSQLLKKLVEERCAMKIGDLVKWWNGDGEYELGIVTSLDACEEYNVMVYFILDEATYEMYKDDLEVV